MAMNKKLVGMVSMSLAGRAYDKANTKKEFTAILKGAPVKGGPRQKSMVSGKARSGKLDLATARAMMSKKKGK